MLLNLFWFGRALVQVRAIIEATRLRLVYIDPEGRRRVATKGGLRPQPKAA